MSEDRSGSVRVRSIQPISTTQRSTDDPERPSGSGSVECGNTRNSGPASAINSSNQGLRLKQDAARVLSPKAPKSPPYPSVVNDQVIPSESQSRDPGANLPNQRSKYNLAPPAISPLELPPRSTYKIPNHPDANKSEQPISTIPAKVSPVNNSTAIPPPTKNTHDNVDLPVSSHSSSNPERPSQGSATAISEFLPQATSTQLPTTPTVSIQSKVSNFSRSKVASKRDRVLKPASKHKAEADISNLTSPDATRVPPISTTPDPGISSSVLPKTGASNTKLTMAKDKKLTASKSKKKEKELVTPLAYAQILCNKLDVLAKKTDFLKGKKLFYTGGDMQYASQPTKKKMELVKSSPLVFYIVITTTFDRSHFDFHQAYFLHLGISRANDSH